MKIDDNGVIRDMTSAEEAAYLQQLADDEAQQRQTPPSFEERMEAQLTYTAMMTDTMLED